MTAAQQPDPLTLLGDYINQLVNPNPIDRRIEYRDPRAHRTVVRHDPWRFASLLDLLREAAKPHLQAPVEGRTAAGSRLLVNAAAVDALTRITGEVTQWRTGLDLPTRGSLDDDMRALVGAAGNLDSATVANLLDDAWRWWRVARAIAGLDTDDPDQSSR